MRSHVSKLYHSCYAPCSHPINICPHQPQDWLDTRSVIPYAYGVIKGTWTIVIIVIGLLKISWVVSIWLTFAKLWCCLLNCRFASRALSLCLHISRWDTRTPTLFSCTSLLCSILWWVYNGGVVLHAGKRTDIGPCSLLLFQIPYEWIGIPNAQRADTERATRQDRWFQMACCAHSLYLHCVVQSGYPKLESHCTESPHFAIVCQCK